MWIRALLIVGIMILSVALGMVIQQKTSYTETEAYIHEPAVYVLEGGTCLNPDGPELAGYTYTNYWEWHEVAEGLEWRSSLKIKEKFFPPPQAQTVRWTPKNAPESTSPNVKGMWMMATRVTWRCDRGTYGK